MTTTQTPSALVALVSDSTPSYLEYGDYRGYVLLDATTGEWVSNLTEEQVARLVLGSEVYTEEYGTLAPVLADEYHTDPAINAVHELERLAYEQDAYDAKLYSAVGTARTLGLTWETIGHALGITRQGAQKRWGHML